MNATRPGAIVTRCNLARNRTAAADDRSCAALHSCNGTDADPNQKARLRLKLEVLTDVQEFLLLPPEQYRLLLLHVLEQHVRKEAAATEADEERIAA